jgi:hypothetical protein
VWQRQARERARESERERERDRQTDRQIDRERETERTANIDLDKYSASFSPYLSTSTLSPLVSLSHPLMPVSIHFGQLLPVQRLLVDMRDLSSGKGG